VITSAEPKTHVVSVTQSAVGLRLLALRRSEVNGERPGPRCDCGEERAQRCEGPKTPSRRHSLAGIGLTCDAFYNPADVKPPGFFLLLALLGADSDRSEFHAWSPVSPSAVRPATKRVWSVCCRYRRVSVARSLPCQEIARDLGWRLRHVRRGLREAATTFYPCQSSLKGPSTRYFVRPRTTPKPGVGANPSE
jgi:hypothetical protein